MVDDKGTKAMDIIQTGDRDDWRVNYSLVGGPWIVECGQTTANPEVGNLIASVRCSRYDGHGRCSNFPEVQRVCNLLSAAPMLLAALKAMLEQHGKPHREEWINPAAFEQAKVVDAAARAAIAKASA